MTELHTQTCPVCGARDEESKIVDGKKRATEDLRGVYFVGMFEGSHEWQCIECGHNWLTAAGFVREPRRPVLTTAAALVAFLALLGGCQRAEVPDVPEPSRIEVIEGRDLDLYSRAILLRVDGHEYLTVRRGGVVHLASCPAGDGGHDGD